MIAIQSYRDQRIAVYGLGRSGLATAEALVEAGADAIVVDTAHGHSAGVIEAIRRIKQISNYIQVIAGNVAQGFDLFFDGAAHSGQV